jgi:DNA-directed RNA polymerase specialized sigma24 family protein
MPVTSDQIEQVYRRCRSKARALARRRLRGSPSLVDDAVQAAVLYLLEQAARMDTLTDSYFMQLVASRASNMAREESRRNQTFVAEPEQSD